MHVLSTDHAIISADTIVPTKSDSDVDFVTIAKYNNIVYTSLELTRESKGHLYINPILWKD